MEVSALKYTGGIGLNGRAPLLRLQSDERLITLLRRGNMSAFEVLVSRYESRLLAFCRHLLGSREDAEDVLQEVMTAAFNAILADNRPINVRPWLYRIARNRSLNHLRKMQAIGVDSMDHHLAEHGASTADKVHEREEFRMLVGDIHELPETQRTALVLREMDALSYDQIAEAMETTVSSVKSLLVRARVSLAEAAEARLLSCEDVRIELAEIAEGLLKKPSPLVRRHLRDCTRCTVFKAQLKQCNKALAALMPIGALGVVRKLVFLHLTHSAGSSAAAAGSSAGSGAGAAGAGAGAAGAGAAVAGAGAAASSTGLLSAGIGAVAGKAAAGLAAAALVTAGAVEVNHHPATHSTATSPTHVAAVAPAPRAATAPAPSEAEAQGVSSAPATQRQAKKTAMHVATTPASTTTTTTTTTTSSTPTTATSPAPTTTETTPGRTQTQQDPTVLPPSTGTGMPTDPPAAPIIPTVPTPASSAPSQTSTTLTSPSPTPAPGSTSSGSGTTTSGSGTTTSGTTTSGTTTSGTTTSGTTTSGSGTATTSASGTATSPTP
jgi:RNA polymerase sigma factor (sigma-70 family)